MLPKGNMSQAHRAAYMAPAPKCSSGNQKQAATCWVPWDRTWGPLGTASPWLLGQTHRDGTALVLLVAKCGQDRLHHTGILSQALISKEES